MRVGFFNTGAIQLDDLVIRADFPTTLALEPGSTTIYGVSWPEGSAISDNVGTAGVNVGSYSPGAGAYLVFLLRVADPPEFDCGLNRLVVRAKVESDFGTVAANSVISVDRWCNPA